MAVNSPFTVAIGQRASSVHARRSTTATWRTMCAILLTCACAGWAQAQDVVQTPAPSTNLSSAPTETVPLTVPKGTPIQVMLDREVKVEKAGQPIHGRVAEPVYAFDKLVVPAGAEVTGQISKIEDISTGKRTLSALDADFTPAHKVQIEFTEIVLADGRQIPMHTVVTPGSGQVIQLVTAADDPAKKKGVKDAASEKVKQAKEEAKRDWDMAMKQVHEPGKMRKIERYAVAQLPFHPQYISAGTVYFAELQEPLSFGAEPLTTEMAHSIGGPPPLGSLVHARLVTPLSSATSKKGEEVEAVLSQPLFDGDRLIFPQGSRLKGSVVQVQPARHLSHNGQLRIVFHQLTLPDGIEQKVDASLEGIQSGKDQHVKLDSEGGAVATSPKSRYLTTGVSVMLAAASLGGDGDRDAGNRAAGGAGGYKLIGLALGMAVHSQPLGMAMGTFGASRTFYAHFIARGRDVVFAKNTAMEIGIGARTDAAAKPAEYIPQRK